MGHVIWDHLQHLLDNICVRHRAIEDTDLVGEAGDAKRIFVDWLTFLEGGVSKVLELVFVGVAHALDAHVHG